MTVATLHMPRLGETMEKGTVSSWLVPVGDHFERGTPLVEFETDKTAVELPALGSGRLIRRLVEAGDTVKLGEPVAEIELDGEHDWVSATATASVPDSESAAVPDHKAGTDRPGSVGGAVAPDGKKVRHGNEISDQENSTLGNTPVRATPPARRAAWRAGLEMERIPGTGRRGRIELSDVETFQTRQDAGRLAATEWGPSGGVRVVLVHGFAGDMTTFDQLGRSLGRSGMAVRAVDLPGHGETRAEAASFDHLVDGLIGELTNAGPVNVVAHSLGAAAAVKAASLCRVASLTLISPAGLGHTIDGDFIAGMASPGSIGETAYLLRRLSNRADRFSEQVVSDIYTTLCRGRLVRLATDVARGDHQLVNVVRPLAELSERMPVRILVGHRDRVIDWRDALAVSPNIGIHHFPEAGHMPHWDFPTEVGELLERAMLHESG